MDPEAEAALQDLKKYLSSTPILVAPKPQEPLLLYLAATNQVDSAALVAQREVNEEAAATAGLADGEPDFPLAGPGAGKARPPAESDAIGTGPVQPNEVVQKKKMMQHPVYFVSSLLQGLGQDIPVCRNCSSASLWPRGSCVITSKPTRSLSSPASRCNGYCTTQMQPEGLWSGPWSCLALG